MTAWPALPPSSSGADVDRYVPGQAPHELVRRPLVGTVVWPPMDTGRGRELAARAGYTVAFHASRAPTYGARLAVRAPVGVWRLTCRGVAWLSDDEGRRVRRSVSAAGVGASGSGPFEAQHYVRVCAEHRSTQAIRLRIAGGGLVFALLAGLAAWLLLPPAAWVGIAAVVVLVLGWVGRDVSAPVVATAAHTTVAGAVPPITSTLVVDALGTLGIGELNKALRDDEHAVRFVAPITRDGEGWRADIDLPGGVTAGDVVERRDRLASGLRRPEGCVWPEPDSDGHAGRLVLWVADRPMSTATPVPWPLMRAGRTNLFEPVPFGVDQRGRPVTITLMFASMVLGAVPRQGKTAALRLLLLASALDPRAELHVHNLKGGGDLDPLGAVAHYCRSGDDPEDIDALLADLRAIREDMRRRYKVMRELPRDVAPDAKVTDELASRRDLGLHPVVIGLDEVQVMFEHAKHGSEFDELVTDLVKRGPAVGITVICATQRPDAKSLPSGIRANAVLRFCLRVTSQVEVDMVLGTSAYRRGLRPTMFSRQDLGVGYLLGDGDDPTIVRAAYVDTPTADVVAARARAARERAGLLSGMAAGDDLGNDDRRDMADLVLSVWPEDDRPKLWHSELAERLDEAGHAVDQRTVSAGLRALGVGSVQVYRDGTNRAGAARTDIVGYLAGREGIAVPLDPPHTG